LPIPPFEGRTARLRRRRALRGGLALLAHALEDHAVRAALEHAARTYL